MYIALILHNAHIINKRLMYSDIVLLELLDSAIRALLRALNSQMVEKLHLNQQKIQNALYLNSSIVKEIIISRK